MLSQLVYRDLRTEREEIRVLELHSAWDFNAPLHCTLRHKRLADAKYSALSYVWGQQELDTAVLKIDYEGKTYGKAIGSSLARALRNLRRNVKRVPLWADALCVNQSQTAQALAERSWQVNNMNLIYERATNVHAWLGPRFYCPGEEPGLEGSIEAAFDVAEAIWDESSRMQTSRVRWTNPPSTEEQWLQVCLTMANNESASFKLSSQQADRWAPFATALREAAISNSAVRRGLSALTDASRAEYFSRVWILQEVGRARSLTFRYGKRHISHLHLLLALSVAMSLKYSQNHTVEKALLVGLDVKFLRCLEARVTCTENSSVRKVLELAYFSPPPIHKATDSRDLVYARLGLASNKVSASRALKADYSVTVGETYTSATRFLLSEGFTDLLVTFRPYKFMQGLPAETLPSWTHDWSAPRIGTFNIYNASGNTKPQISFISYPGARFGQAMAIAGCIVGTVKELGERFSKLVEEAGFSKKAVIDCTLNKDLGSLHVDRNDNMVTKMKDLHAQLGIDASEASIHSLFRDHPIDVSKFWCWWLLWMRGVLKLRAQRKPQESDNLMNLLFCRAPLSQDNTTKLNTGTLLNLQQWLDSLFLYDGPRAPGTELAKACFRSAWGMRAATLDTGHLCYLPELSRQSDRVVIFHGVKAPLVLRQLNDGKTQRIVGPAHVQGVMRGEFLETNPPTNTYTLV